MVTCDFQHHFFRFCCFCCMKWKRSNLGDNLRLLRFLSRYAHSKPRLCGVISSRGDESAPALLSPPTEGGWA
jgi:hypothetical protein